MSDIEIYTTIKDYNKYLINSLSNIKLDEYFKYIIINIYNNINIDFMEEFLELCNHGGEFCINHKKLQEYKVINNISNSSNILKTLNGCNLKENEDYQLRNVSQQSESSRGIKYAKEYLLTPYAFKYV